MRSLSDGKCDECGAKLRVGDYPYCKDGSGHSTMYSRNAQTAAPTVIFRNRRGEYRLPGRDNDKPPRGFERIELRTQRARDAFEREFGARETAKLHDVEYGRREAYKHTFAKSREKLLEIKNRSQSEYTKKFVDLCIADGERRLAQSVGMSEAGFMVESNHMDAQNRVPYQDKATGWKPRR